MSGKPGLRSERKQHYKLQRIEYTNPSDFIWTHQRTCPGTFKQVSAYGSSESFGCKLCESTYTKTYRSYNQFKFEGTLIQPIMPNTRPKENANA